MDLQNWLNDLEQRTDRRGAYLEFETFVLKLLEKLAGDEGKSFERPLTVDRRGHTIQIGFAPDGIADLPGPTLIDAKFFRAAHRENLRYIASERSETAVILGAKSFLFVVAAKLNTADKGRLAPASSAKILTRIWDIEDLTLLARRFSGYVADLIPCLPSIAIGGVVERSVQVPSDAWIEKRKDHLNQLQKAYRQNDLVLMLGAGVSMAAGLPTWEILLSRLLVSMIERKLPASLHLTDDDRSSIAVALKNIHGASPLLEARYVRAGLDLNFNHTLAELLYSNKNPTDQAPPLLESLARLCVPKRSGPGVRAVITYNFDDLLEQRLNEFAVPHRSIYGDDDIPGQDELGVYHVHGFLPRNMSAYADITKSLLVFSEENYHKLFLEPYTWSNIVQVNLLRETTCLLVGLSVTDPNLRRLLDIAARRDRGPKHYVLLKRVLPKEVTAISRGEIPLREDVAQAFISAHHELQETAFEELGLNIIWVENHGEVPELIRKIRGV